jgi:hypothetical protein
LGTKRVGVPALVSESTFLEENHDRIDPVWCFALAMRDGQV